MRLAIDFGAIFWRAWKARDGGDPGENACRIVDRIVMRDQPDSVVIGLDSEKSLRKERFPAYKAKRPPKPDGYDEAKAAVEHALGSRWPVASREGWEADDILGFYATTAWTDGAVVIASHDKDLLQLIDERVTVYNMYTDEAMFEDDVVNKYGVFPWQMVDYLAICGDPVDGVPGIHRWGPVKARKVLQEHHSIDRALAVGVIPRAEAPALRTAQWLIRLCPERDSVPEEDRAPPNPT